MGEFPRPSRRGVPKQDQPRLPTKRLPLGSDDGEGEGSDEEEPPEPADSKSASESLMLAAAAALLEQGKKKKKKKRAWGISVAEGSGESSGSEELVAGAKGIALAAKLTRSMEAHPDQFLSEMRVRMDRHLGGSGSSDTAKSSRRAEDYVRQLPLEKQKVLGYHLWTLAQVYRMLREKNSVGAELCCLRGIAAAEQSMLDSHWRSAWPLTGLGEPPWPEWERSSAAIHKRSHHASPLLKESWVSVAVGRTKDEAFLRKQRNDAPPPREGGGGREGGR
jgi:hypothetical protein